MGSKLLRIVLLLAATALVLMAAGCGGDDEGDGGGTGGQLVFAGAADPVVLDGALVSDGESLRVIDQMFEGLVTLKPGTTEIVAGLAESWEADAAGTSWTFKLRDGVTFHDGEAFNAEAVCFNFNRWYNFKGPFQLESATYYWQTVFGGFSDKKTPSLFESCEAQDASTVVINLTKPSSSFLGALALTNFTFASPKALQEFGADEGTVDEETGFKPTGTYGTEHPTGTGPFKFVSWTRGDRLVLERNDDYWGDKAKLDQVIFRPIADNAARLQALQSGDIQGYDLVEPQDIATIQGDDSLQVLDRPAFNVAYVGINQKTAPMDKLEVRQALAYGLDRQSVVDNFYAGRGEVAKEFMPPSLEGYADDVTEYTYDPAKAKQLLQQAGVTTPLQIDFWYPTDVSRPYMPDPKRNFEAFAASLNKSGFKVVPHSAPWSPDYLGRVQEGKAGHIHLLGWTGDFGDADNFIGVFFQTETGQFGFKNQELFNALDQAEQETDAATRERQYGLDEPLPVQYWSYVKTVGQGDLGTSVTTRRPVTDELKQRFPATIELALAAMLFSVGLGIPLGFVAAKRYGGVLDHASLVASLIGISIPVFFLAILLKYVFAVELGLLPTVGRISALITIDHPTNFYVLDAILAGDGEALWDTLKHLILPAVALGSIPLAVIARITRAAVLDVQNEDYVRTARAKGLEPRIVDERHIFRNALLPISTIIGLQTGLLLSGAVLTETVFAWPGMGTWLVDAIEQRNFPVLQGGILFVSLLFVLVNLLVDISYALINPRIRVS